MASFSLSPDKAIKNFVKNYTKKLTCEKIII